MSKTDKLKSQIGAAVKESASSLPRATPTLGSNQTLRNREKDRNTFLIDPDLITINEQVRQEFDDEDIASLADSMSTHGQLQALVVSQNAQGEYLLVAGERRLRAARLAGLTQVRCDILGGDLTDERVLELQMVENLQRVDLNPIDEARGYQSLIDEYNWSLGKIAKSVGKNKSSVSRALALLKLPDHLIEKLRNGAIPPRVGRELARLDKQADQEQLLQRYLAKELTSAEVANEITNRQRCSRSRPGPDRAKTHANQEEASPFVKHFQTKHARITLEHDDPQPSKADLQAELLAAVKSLGKDRLR